MTAFSQLVERGWKIVAIGRKDHGYGATIEEAIAAARAKGDKETKLFALFICHPNSFVNPNGDLVHPKGEDPLLLVKRISTGVIYSILPYKKS